MEELWKFDFKIKVIPNGLEKYVIFSLDIKIDFIYSFQCSSSLLDTLAKNLGENNFQHLSGEFDCKVFIYLFIYLFFYLFIYLFIYLFTQGMNISITFTI